MLGYYIQNNREERELRWSYKISLNVEILLV